MLMRYWQTEEGRQKARGIVTIHMISEFLGTFGYHVTREPVLDTQIVGIAVRPDDQSFCIPKLQGSGILFIGDSAMNMELFPEGAASFIILADNGSIPNSNDSHVKHCLNSAIVLARRPQDNVTKLQNDISNFILSIEKYVAALSAVKTVSAGYQGLLDVSEEFFGHFISLCDSNNRLIAHTMHIDPPDQISTSLVKYGYHREDIVLKEMKTGYLSDLLRGQRGIKVFPPEGERAVSLVTSPIILQGAMHSYLVMSCYDGEITPGTIDIFKLLVEACTKTARLIEDGSEYAPPGKVSFLLGIIENQFDDPLYIDQRANSLDIPLDAHFAVMRSDINQGETFLSKRIIEELGRSSGRSGEYCQLTAMHKGSVVLLLWAFDDMSLIKGIKASMNLLSEMTTATAYCSDVFRSLRETYSAFRSLNSVAKYCRGIERIHLVSETAMPQIATFRAAFAFYWNDPFRDRAIQDFVIKYMVTRTIEQDDKDHGTENLEILTSYLINERKAQAVADKSHFSRNGVLYRIKKIEDTYYLDLDNFIDRQYILACLRVDDAL